MDRPQIQALVFECLTALNAERGADEQVPVAEDTELLSETSKLDSLGFVAFSTDLEDRLRDRTGKDLMLASAALDGASNPFRTVRTLVDHIAAELPRA